jgi:hypothetical protein
LAGQAGFDVTVAEQARTLRPSGSPVDVHGQAVEVAERMGVMARIRDAEVELPRGDLAAILRDAVPDCVEVQFANSVQALIQDADGVTAEFTVADSVNGDIPAGLREYESRHRPQRAAKENSLAYATRLFIPATWAGIAVRNLAVQLIPVLNRLQRSPQPEYNLGEIR